MSNNINYNIYNNYSNNIDILPPPPPPPTTTTTTTTTELPSELLPPPPPETSLLPPLPPTILPPPPPPPPPPRHSYINYHGSFSRGGAFKTKGFVDPSFYSSSVLVPINKNSQFSLHITSTETVVQRKKSYTVYVIRVKSDQHQWEVVRRYKHFRVFSIQINNEVFNSNSSSSPSSSTSSLGTNNNNNNNINNNINNNNNNSNISSASSLNLSQTITNSIQSFEFPSKKLIGNMNPNFIKNRKEQLEKFLQLIASSQVAKLSRNLKVFLDPNFSPSLRTIVNPSKEGFLYLLKPPSKYSSLLNSKKQWIKVYCIATNSNLFYWKNREQPYAEARGIIQLCHCTTRIMTKQDKKCIQLNENSNNTSNSGDNSKYLLTHSKGKSFSHKINHNDIYNNINNVNNNNNSANNTNNSNNNNSNTVDSNEVYYLSADSDVILEQWVETIEKETFRYQKDIQQQQSVLNYPPQPLQQQYQQQKYDSSILNIENDYINSNDSSSSNNNSFINSENSNSNNSSPRLSRNHINKSNRKSIRKLYKDDDIIEEIEEEFNSNININNNNNNNNSEGSKEYKLLESVLTNSKCKDLLIDANYVNDDSLSNYSTPSASILNLTKSLNLNTNLPIRSNTTTTNTTTTTTTTNTTNTTDNNSNKKKVNDEISSIELLHSEEITYFAERIIHMHQNTGTIGSITITNYRFYFSATVGGKIISIPLTTISKIFKCVGFTLDKVKYYAFELICKDFNRARFMHLPGSSQQKANSRLFEILESLIFKQKQYQQLFCFKNEEILGGYDGWHIYQPLKEFQRQSIPNEDWRVSHYNNDYQYSPTYPNLLIVPKRITDQELINTTPFRSKGRIPTLVWKSPNSNSVITRCSQPVIGVTKKRSLDDEKLIESILLANPQSEKVYIMDARPQLNAVANQMMGLGYEDTNNQSYNNCILKFLNIENIHKMRHCQKKLFKSIMSDSAIYGINENNSNNNNNNSNNGSGGSGGSNNLNSSNILNLEESTKDWLEHIKSILNGTLDIVDTIQFYKSSVVVHCSDGWDRTSQLCSLAQLLLDPYYRTVIGFQVLIEKEWCSFGHKFESRIGHAGKNEKKSEELSPIFLQFIDCVWQIMQQNPTSFQFNSKYLLEIIHHLYSCRFGTFLFDCQEKRVSANLMSKTTSLWSYINQNQSPYFNKNYIYNSDEPPIRIDTSELSLWSEYYLHWRNFYLSN
ncbi:hypothetical protein ACTFIU_003813 [Dictyostelium citrinum]